MALLLVVYTLNACSCQLAARAAYVDVREGVQVGCVMMLAGLALPLCCIGMCIAWKSPSPNQGITIRNALVVVYGMGCFMFVSVYCFAGLTIAPVFWFIVGTSTLAIDDALVYNDRTNPRLPSYICIAACISACAFLLNLSEHNTFSFLDSVDRGDWFVICMGILFPISIPCVMHTLRSSGCSSTQIILQSVQLATPCAVLIATWVLFHDCKRADISDEMIGNSQGNETYHSSVAPFHPPSMHSEYWAYQMGPIPTGIIVLAVPLTMIPTLVLTVRTILENNTLDVICMMTVVFAGKHVINAAISPSTGPSVIAAGMALAVRLYGLSIQSLTARTTMYMAAGDS